MPSHWASPVALGAVLKCFRSTSKEAMLRAGTSVLWKNLWSKAQHQACATRKPFFQPWLESSPGQKPSKLDPAIGTWRHTALARHEFRETNFGFKSPPPGITFWEPFWASKLRAGGHNSEASFGFEFWYLATNFLKPVWASEFVAAVVIIIVTTKF